MKKNVNIPGWPEQFTPTLPDTPSNPFAESLAGGVDFMRNFWSQTPNMVPGLTLPTVDLDDLDKRIKDLKAVESWLEMNHSLLRATIQTLEVQRNTVATIKAFGASFTGASQNMNEAMTNAFKTAAGSGRTAEDPPPPSEPPPSLKSTPQASVPPASGSFADTGTSAPARYGLPAGWPSSTAPAAAPPSSQPAAESAETSTPAPEHVDVDRAGRRVPTRKSDPGSESQKDSQAAAGQPPFSPNAWLEFLQDQFNKVAAATLMPDRNTNDAGTRAAPPAAAKKTSSAPAKKKAATKVAAKKSGKNTKDSGDAGGGSGRKA